ncbi:MAG: hypothetical protein ACLS69_02235 [Butyricicoccus sp.]
MNYHHGPFIALLPLLAACGYSRLFAGMFFGDISSRRSSVRKTVEGAVGGGRGAVLRSDRGAHHEQHAEAGLPLWAAVVLGAVGDAGRDRDLSRSSSVRPASDYGHIFPGHGGGSTA